MFKRLLFAGLAVAAIAPLAAQANGPVSVSVSTPQFGIRIGAPIFGPPVVPVYAPFPVYSPPVYSPPIYAPPVYAPPPVVYVRRRCTCRGRAISSRRPSLSHRGSCIRARITHRAS